MNRMSEKRSLPYLTTGASHEPPDQFLSLVERLEAEADPQGGLDRRVRAVDPGARRPLRAAEAPPFEGLVDTLRTKLGLPRPASVLSALRNAELRTAFLAEVGALTAAEVATLAGSRAKNSSALAGRWRAERRIMAVPWGGELLYPAFQFRDGEPRQVIARVLEGFGERPSAWEVALWFATPSPYLPGDARPLDRLDDADAVVRAAAAEHELPEF